MRQSLARFGWLVDWLKRYMAISVDSPGREGLTMSKIRRESAWQRRRRLKIPKGHCTWCRKPVVRPSVHWCAGEQCLSAFKATNDVATIRALVEKRDHGICALCGNDPGEWERLWNYFGAQAADLHARARQSWRDRGGRGVGIGNWGCRCVWCEASREAAKLRQWQADHILPVAEGGGQCQAPNGYRTLCIFCHKRETKALAARLAKARRNKKQRVKNKSRRAC